MQKMAEAGLKAGERQRQVIELYERDKIPQMDAGDYKERGGKLLKYLWRDLGLPGEPELYDQIRWLDFLLNYYADFSLDEVKIAFEYFIAGRLDTRFKRKPVHYGKWSIDFASQVLKAYREKRGDVVMEVTRQLPRSAEWSEEKKAEVKTEFYSMLRRNLIAAKKGKKNWPREWNTLFIHRTLCELGLLSPTELSDKSIELAYSACLTNNNLTAWEKRKVREEYGNGKINDVLARMAETIEVGKEIEQFLEMTDVQTIKNAFDGL